MRSHFAQPLVYCIHKCCVIGKANCFKSELIDRYFRSCSFVAHEWIKKQWIYGDVTSRNLVYHANILSKAVLSVAFPRARTYI